MNALTADDIDRLTAAAITAELGHRERRGLLLAGIPSTLAANLPDQSRPADQLRSDLTTLAGHADPAPLAAWLQRAEQLAGDMHPVNAHIFARYARRRHAILAGAAGSPAPTWVKTALIQAGEIVDRGLGSAHGAERVARFEASDGGLVLEHIGHFTSGPPVDLLWLHLVGELVVERRRLRLRTPDGQGLRLDELAEEVAATEARSRVLLIDVDPATDPAALAWASALDWGPLTLRAIAPGLTAALAIALEGGACTAGALCAGLGGDAVSDAPDVELAAATGRSSTTGDAAEMATVVSYLEALRTRCREIALRQRDPKLHSAEAVYVPLHTTSPADGAEERGRRKRPDDEARAPRTVHDRVAEHRCLFIVGEPGSGKTTTLRRLCGALCDAHLAREPGADWMPARPLPVWLDLRDLPPPPTGAPCRARDLLDHAFAHLEQCDGRAPMTPAVADRALREGRLVLILDGLDEVPSPDLRRAWAETITSLAKTQARRCRVWVSCREAARAAGAEPGPPLVRVDLQPFDRDQQARVIAAWLRSRVADPTALAAEVQRLLADLSRHPEVARQTGSPLILALICLLHFAGRGLPDSRVDLYGRLIELFVRDRERGVGSAVSEVEPHHRRAVLTDLAWRWWVDGGAQLAEGRAEPPGLLQDRCVEVVAGGLAACRPELSAARRRALAVELVAFFDQRAGMLRWQGDDPATGQRRFAFAHRTFAEFLVACRLSEDEELRQRHHTERFARDPSWREVFVMFTALLGRSETGVRAPAWAWVTTLAGWAADEQRPADDRARFARLAAECLEPCRDRPPPAEVVEAVDGLQATLLDAERCVGFPAAQRVGFWLAIGSHNRLVSGPTAADRWVHIPGGRFWRGAAGGDELAYDDERPAGWVEMSPFAIQAWPVLVMEYADFVERGYGDPQGARPPWWSDAGWAWRIAEPEARPRSWFAQQQQRPTHPVTGVNFWEAEAYAGWLDARGLGPGPGRVGLPSEAQWERAARGSGEPSKARRYPWGFSDDPDRRNGGRLHEHTTPIGAFPGGRTLEGIWSLTGNVWEWCVDGASDQAVAPLYESAPGVDPIHPVTPERVLQVLRGGARRSVSQYLRLSCRHVGRPSFRFTDAGFRCVWRCAPRSLGA